MYFRFAVVFLFLCICLLFILDILSFAASFHLLMCR